MELAKGKLGIHPVRILSTMVGIAELESGISCLQV